MNEILTIVLGSNAITVLLTAIITAVSQRKTKLKDIEKKLVKTEKDSVRTQLLLLISDYPDEKKEIMEIAEYYFVTLRSNWYMTSLFNKWLERNNIAKPEWFKGGEEK